MHTRALDIQVAITGTHRVPAPDSAVRIGVPVWMARVREGGRSAAAIGLRAVGRLALLAARMVALPLVYAALLVAGIAHLTRRGAAIARGRRDDPGFDAALLLLLLIAAAVRDGATTPGSTPRRARAGARGRRPYARNTLPHPMHASPDHDTAAHTLPQLAHHGH